MEVHQNETRTWWCDLIYQRTSRHFCMWLEHRKTKKNFKCFCKQRLVFATATAISSAVTASAAHSSVLFILYLFMIHTVEAVRVENFREAYSFKGGVPLLAVAQFVQTRRFSSGHILVYNEMVTPLHPCALHVEKKYETGAGNKWWICFGEIINR